MQRAWALAWLRQGQAHMALLGGLQLRQLQALHVRPCLVLLGLMQPPWAAVRRRWMWMRMWMLLRGRPRQGWHGWRGGPHGPHLMRL